MCVNLSGLNISVAHEFLEHPDVNTVFQHMGGETVPERMTSGTLLNPGPLNSELDRLLEAGLQHMS